MLAVFEIELGTPMLASRVLVPTSPSILRLVNVARPAVADIARVPVKVVFASSVIVWVDCAPLVTTLPSASTMSTTTFDAKLLSFAAVDGAEMVRFAAAPWVNRTV
jgi:hypothetical protein